MHMIGDLAIMLDNSTTVYDYIMSDNRCGVDYAARQQLRAGADFCPLRADGTGMDYGQRMQIARQSQMKELLPGAAITYRSKADCKAIHTL
jgi:hypothetical protein